MKCILKFLDKPITILHLIGFTLGYLLGEILQHIFN
jgi:hypothetical protein